MSAVVLVYILCGCAVTQAVTVVYLLVRGKRLSGRLTVVERRINTRTTRMDELAHEHDELRALFNGKAHDDLRQAEQILNSQQQPGP